MKSVVKPAQCKFCKFHKSAYSTNNYYQSSIFYHFYNMSTIVHLILFVCMSKHAICRNTVEITVSRFFEVLFQNRSKTSECALFVHSNPLLKETFTSNDLGHFREKDKITVTGKGAQNITTTHFVSVSKFKSRCVIAMVEDSQGVFLSKVLPRWQNILRIEEDYFIFLLHNDLAYKSYTSATEYPVLKNQVSAIYKRASVYIAVSSAMSDDVSLKETVTGHSTNKDSFLINNAMFPGIPKSFHVFRQLVVSCPTFTQVVLEIHKLDTGHYHVTRGSMHFAFVHLMIKYNFTAKFIPSTGGGTGRRQSNGSWVGTVGDVLNGRADIGQVTGHIYGRDTIVQFSNTIQYIWLTFASSIPQPYYSWKSVYRPFSNSVWACILLSCVISSAVLYINLKRNTSGQGTLGATVLILLTGAMEQDIKCPSAAHSYRFMISVWLVFILLVATAYRSQLVIFLLFPSILPVPSTFDELARSNYHISLHYVHGAAYSLIKNSANPTFMAIYQRMDLDESVLNCLGRVTRESGFACIVWQVAEHSARHENLSDRYGYVPMVNARDTSAMTSLGLIYRKGSILKETFDQTISQAFDMGLVEKWKQFDSEVLRKRRNTFPDYSKFQQDNHQKYLKLKHLSGTFYMLLVGFSVTILAFPVELICAHWHRKN